MKRTLVCIAVRQALANPYFYLDKSEEESCD